MLLTLISAVGSLSIPWHPISSGCLRGRDPRLGGSNHPCRVSSRHGGCRRSERERHQTQHFASAPAIARSLAASVRIEESESDLSRTLQGAFSKPDAREERYPRLQRVRKVFLVRRDLCLVRSGAAEPGGEGRPLKPPSHKDTSHGRGLNGVLGSRSLCKAGLSWPSSTTCGKANPESSTRSMGGPLPLASWSDVWVSHS